MGSHSVDTFEHRPTSFHLQTKTTLTCADAVELFQRVTLQQLERGFVHAFEDLVQRPNVQTLRGHANHVRFHRVVQSLGILVQRAKA